MRTFNLRLLFWLVGIFLAVAVVVHFVHGFQVRRNAGVYKTLAEKERNLAEEGLKKAENCAKISNDVKKPQAERDAANAEARNATASARKAAENAIQHYRRYLAFVPGNVSVRADYARLLVKVGALTQANSQLERVLREGGGDDETRKMLVDVAMRLGLYPSAEHHLAILLDKAENKDSALLEKLGSCQLLRGEYEKAKESLESAIKNSPNQLTSYWLLADVLRDRLKNPEAARNVVDEMADRNRDTANAHVLRAEFLLRDRQPLTEKESLAEAEKACSRALELQSENSDALALASNCQQRKGDLVAARELLRNSLDFNPNVPQRYLDLAVLERQASPHDPKAGLDAAIAVLRQGVQAIPEPLENFELRWKLVDLLISKEKSEEELTELKTFQADLRQFIDQVKKLPNVDATQVARLEARVEFLKAWKLASEGTWPEARLILESRRGDLEKSPDLIARADALLAQCYRQQGDTDLFLAASRRVLDRNPTDGEARKFYAESLAAAGRLSEAASEYDQLVRMYGNAIPLDVLKRRFELRLSVSLRKRDTRTSTWQQLDQELNAIQGFEPNDPWAPTMKAEVLAQRGEFSAAENVLVAACASDGMRNVQALRGSLFSLALRQNDLAKATERLTALETEFGDSVALRLARARLLIKQKGKEGVAELAGLTEDVGDFEEPERLQLYLQLALLSRSEGDMEQALAFGRQAAQLSLAERNLPIWLFLLQMAQAATSVESAEKAVKEIGGIDQGGAVTLYSQAVCDLTRYQADKDENRSALQSARNKLLQAEQIRPKWMQLQVLLGKIAREEKDDESAERAFRRAVELGCRDIDVIRYVTTSLLKKNQADEAYQIVASFAQEGMTPTLEIGQIESRIALELGEYKKAMEMALELVDKLGSQNPEDHLLVGMLYDLQNDPEKARPRLQKAIELIPTEPAPYLAMVRMLAKQARKADEKGDKAAAAALRTEADQIIADTTKCVAEANRTQVVAQCLAYLDRQGEALKMFNEALEAAPDDPILLEAAARFYMQDRRLWGMAAKILDRFARGEFQLAEPTAAWARRELARVLGGASGYRDFLQAMKLSAANLKSKLPKEPAMPEDLILSDEDLKANLNRPEDLEVRAMLLASQNLPSLQKEGLRILERLGSQRSLDLQTKAFVAQRYVDLGNWAKGSQLLAEVAASASQGNQDESSHYLSMYINALLNHYEASEAQVWLQIWKKKESEKEKEKKSQKTVSKDLRMALLEARMLVPKTRPGSDASAPMKVQEAIQLLQQAVDDDTVKIVTGDELKSEEQKSVKIGLVIRTLEDLLKTAESRKSPADEELLKNAIQNYYEQMIGADPTRQLMKVRYLVQQGQRRKAVDLLNQYWEQTPIEMLITAGDALLDTKDERSKIEARRGTPEFTEEKERKLTADVDSEVAETEHVLMKAAVKKQDDLQKATDEKAKSGYRDEIVVIESLLASHYLNAERYEEAVKMYENIRSRDDDNVNVVALNNLAMITKDSDPAAALQKITTALEVVGPAPIFVDSQAMVLLAAGEKQKALAAAQRVMSEKPMRLDPAVDEELARQWGGYYFHLALILNENGDTAAAATAWRESKKLGFTEEDVFKMELPAWQRLADKFK